MKAYGLILAGTLSFASAAWSQATAPVQYLSVKPDAMMSSSLVGLDVYNQNNENVGEIKDVVFHNGQLSGYVLSVGGFLGVGERYVAVQPSSISVSYDESARRWKATANTTKDDLKSAPEFKYHGKWKD
jgi:sporulation protein YlmC with PRC-barrel domain